MGSNFRINTLCKKTGKLETLSHDSVCLGCGRKLLSPLEGDKHHQTGMPLEELEAHMDKRYGKRRTVWSASDGPIEAGDWEN
jgi:hypothetical protein